MDCFFRSEPRWFNSNQYCSISKKLFKKIKKEKKNIKNYCTYTYLRYCPIFKKFERIYNEILKKDFHSCLELHRYSYTDKENIDHFIEVTALAYYKKYYQQKYINHFIEEFKVKTGILLADECIEMEKECPYFVLANDIIKKPKTG